MPTAAKKRKNKHIGCNFCGAPASNYCMKQKATTDRQQIFLELADSYKDVIAKVCSVYASESAPFSDLYQEVMINLWTGLESFRGDAKVSTWIYRLAINTCITWHRRNKRHSLGISIDPGFDIADTPDDSTGRIKELYRLISQLEPFDKALVTLWLDEKPYDEISSILGISKANVATRLHRVRAKLSDLANQ